MLETILHELQREGINALNRQDKFLAMADEAVNEEEAARRRRDAHAEHDIAASLAWVYSRTMEGACAADIINLWDRIRKGDKNNGKQDVCG